MFNETIAPVAPGYVAVLVAGLAISPLVAARLFRSPPGGLGRAWLACVAACVAASLSSCGPGRVAPASQAAVEVDGWKSLFDGKTLEGWTVSEVGGQGSVVVKDAAIHMGMGEATTGVTYTGAVPREGYEVSLEVTRLAGVDFPCALTFPVGGDHLTFVVGGWGGSVTGVSCIDGYDAANNPYSRFVKIEDKRWYPVRVRVTGSSVECWLDGERLIHIRRGGRKFSVRIEVEEFVPLGVSTWQTYGAVRNIKLRRLN